MKNYTGLNMLDRVMKAEKIRDMLKIIKPYLDRDKYARLKRVVKLQRDNESKRGCIIRYAEEIMRGKY